MIVDAHVHFWDPDLLHYAWLEDEPVLRRRFLPSDYADFSGGSVDAVVFVQADCAPAEAAQEVDWVTTLARVEPRIAGIVAYVDVNDAECEAAIERLASHPLVVGVRHNIQGHRAGYAMSERFVHGVRSVGARGLPFDLCITAGQIAEVTGLVEAAPATRFVLDHCGKPGIRHDQYDRWAEDISRLAAIDRVSCKLSGLLTEAREDQRSAGGLRRYAEHVSGCFGPARLIYGSDWPVCEIGGGAGIWRRITDELAAAWTADDRRAFYSDNAVRVYHLDVPSHD